MRNLILVAGGWSAADVIPRSNKFDWPTIGVNEAFTHLTCDIGLTMDRLWMENRWDAVADACVARGASFYARTAALKKIEERPPWLRPFECDYLMSEFSDVDGTLNGTNSGACALNLAYQIKPERLFLVGFDMNRSPAGKAYWWGDGYPWAKPGGGTGNTRYQEWAKQFDEAARAFRSRAIAVYNVSPTSAIDSFMRITPKDMWKIINA